jgi:multimeric flavodoxin WrbA
MPTTPLTAIALNCSLKPSPAASSSELLATQVLKALKAHGVTAGKPVRVVNHDIHPGVEVKIGKGDAWPAIRRKILAADILVLSTPTWMGQPSSVCQRVLERLDAELSESDDQGRPLTFGKVAVAAIVGNEDGAHHIAAVLFQVLNDVGFTIPAQGGAYWNGEAMHKTDYKDLPATPETVATATATLAANAAHLAGLLKATAYPPVG